MPCPFRIYYMKIAMLLMKDSEVPTNCLPHGLEFRDFFSDSLLSKLR